MSLSSNYNTRPRAAEVLVEGSTLASFVAAKPGRTSSPPNSTGLKVKRRAV